MFLEDAHNAFLSLVSLAPNLYSSFQRNLPQVPISTQNFMIRVKSTLVKDQHIETKHFVN